LAIGITAIRKEQKSGTLEISKKDTFLKERTGLDKNIRRGFTAFKKSDYMMRQN
jgi:hypothetical protein